MHPLASVQRHGNLDLFPSVIEISRSWQKKTQNCPGIKAGKQKAKTRMREKNLFHHFIFSPFHSTESRHPIGIDLQLINSGTDEDMACRNNPCYFKINAVTLQSPHISSCETLLCMLGHACYITGLLIRTFSSTAARM